MALTYSEAVSLGSLAPEFRLKGTDEKFHSLSDFEKNPEVKGMVIVFMCNHCPYVQAVQERINELAKKSVALGISLIGINPNDSVKYPDDRFEAMKEVTKKWKLSFPYLHDETQEVARAYGAVCTPDFYLYEKSGSGKFKLRYRGRMDDQWKDPTQVKTQDLWEEIQALAKGDPLIRKDSKTQISSMGCSIKWKT